MKHKTMELLIEKYDAPFGYYAVKAENLCGGCAFWKKGKCKVVQGNCCMSER
jgi:hypothetical protein